MANVRIRKDVWKLDEWDDIILWYARGIDAMQQRPLDDPTSWRYQSAIHEYVIGADPLEQPDDTLPSNSEQARFWSQCQHNSWFFLPWHRMYLSFFEQMIMGAVKELGGPEDWALPYWNYSDASNPDARRIPPAFRMPTMPDGSPNPLMVQERVDDANDGEEVADSFDVDIDDCLGEDSFVAAPFGGDPGFGGPQTVFSHSGNATGAVESVPHGSMHMAVGGFNGWMGGFNTAALDPLFWLHHCNIDRLWEVWLTRDQQHLNPTQVEWLTDISFEFHDASGAEVTMTPSEVIDTKAPPLLYEYEDVSDAFGVAPSVRPTAMPRRIDMRRPAMPEMVGATQQGLTLKGQPATTKVAVNRPSGPARALAASEEPKRVYLNVENIKSSGRPESYLVYVNLPEGAQPSDHKELYAGLLPMFGVKESTQTDTQHSGSGLHYTLDITEVVRRLEAENAWNPSEMRVTFIPKRRRAEAAMTAASTPEVEVGRVSLYFS